MADRTKGLLKDFVEKFEFLSCRFDTTLRNRKS